MFQRSSRLISVGIALMLLAAACGGGDDDSAGDNGGTTGTTSGNTAATVVPTAVPNIPGFSDECQALANVIFATTQAFTGISENIDAAFAAAADAVPSELRGDVDVIKDGVEGFAAALNELGVNPFQDPTAFASLTPEQIEKLEEASDLMDSAEVNAAFDRISDWGERECDGFAPGS